MNGIEDRSGGVGRHKIALYAPNRSLPGFVRPGFPALGPNIV
jgi:hypothetical protein